MLERDLYEEYRLNRHECIEYQGYQAFRAKNDLYVIVPIPHIDEVELLEMKQMSDYLQFQKVEGIAQFVPNIKQELISTVGGEQVVLFKVGKFNNRKYRHEGEELARFHNKGRFLPYRPQVATRIGGWKSLWEKRLDQLESWWGERISERPSNQFEKLFYEMFPYYLGVTENAIQYIADCQWEDHRNETQVGTICHMKYQPQHEINTILYPTEFVYDHPSRDIAEWIRSQIYKSSSIDETVQFLNDYERITPLSVTTWRMIFGRLLFPLTFFEIVEGYYSSESDHEKESYKAQFIDYVNRAEENEAFLSSFFKSIGLPVKNLQIPELDWLYRVKN